MNQCKLDRNINKAGFFLEHLESTVVRCSIFLSANPWAIPTLIRLKDENTFIFEWRWNKRSDEGLYLPYQSLSIGWTTQGFTYKGDTAPQIHLIKNDDDLRKFIENTDRVVSRNGGF